MGCIKWNSSRPIYSQLADDGPTLTKDRICSRPIRCPLARDELLPWCREGCASQQPEATSCPLKRVSAGRTLHLTRRAASHSEPLDHGPRDPSPVWWREQPRRGCTRQPQTCSVRRDPVTPPCSEREAVAKKSCRCLPSAEAVRVLRFCVKFRSDSHRPWRCSASNILGVI